MLGVCEGFVLRGFGSRARPDSDYLIVLGAQVREDGSQRRPEVPPRRSRAVPAVKTNPALHRDRWQGPCGAFSRRSGNERIPCRGQEFPTDRIIVEDRALNTVQNIQYSKALMSSPDAPTAIVTNNFHVTRGLALARGQGLTDVCAISAPSDPVPPQQHAPGILRPHQRFPSGKLLRMLPSGQPARGTGCRTAGLTLKGAILLPPLPAAASKKEAVASFAAAASKKGGCRLLASFAAAASKKEAVASFAAAASKKEAVASFAAVISL